MSIDLFDADLVTVSDLASRRRALTSVTQAEIDMAYAQDEERARIVTRYYAAFAVGDEDGLTAAIAEATRYDAAYPGEDLAVELCTDGTERVAA